MTVGGSRPVGIRVYRPVGAHAALVFAHGGSWITGDLDSHDALCRRLAAGTGCVVAAVDYRRAPEHPWPAAVDDVATAVRAVQAEIMPGAPVGLAGDSCGGTLAVLATLRLASEGDSGVTFQALAYPNTDLSLGYPSIRAKGHGWGLDVDDLAWCIEQWVPEPALRTDPRVSPLHSPLLDRLGKTLVVTAEHDPLADEGAEFARRLAAAGVPVAHRTEPDLVHGFLTLTGVPAAAAATVRFVEDVRAMADRAARPGAG